jgi:hypothetical protein
MRICAVRMTTVNLVRFRQQRAIQVTLNAAVNDNPTIEQLRFEHCVERELAGQSQVSTARHGSRR